MKKLRKLFRNFLMLILFSLALTGCGKGDLSCSDVEDDIKKMLKGNDWYATVGIKIDTYQVSFNKAYLVKQMVNRLEKAGYITKEDTHTKGWAKVPKYKFVLNQSIVPYAGKLHSQYIEKEEKSVTLYMSVATLDKMTIEGIEKVGSTKRIVHIRTYFHKNAIGETLGVGESIKSSITYQLYDDGWRKEQHEDFDVSKLLSGAHAGWLADEIGRADEMLENMHDFGYYTPDYKKFIKTIKQSKKENRWVKFPTIAQAYLHHKKYDKALKIWGGEIRRGYQKLEEQGSRERWRNRHEEFKQEHRNTWLWEMHENNQYKRNYKDLLTQLEKTSDHNYLDTVAHVYCDNDEAIKGLNIYTKRILPSLRTKRTDKALLKKFEGYYNKLKKTCGNQIGQVTSSQFDEKERVTKDGKKAVGISTHNTYIEATKTSKEKVSDSYFSAIKSWLSSLWSDNLLSDETQDNTIAAEDTESLESILQQAQVMQQKQTIEKLTVQCSVEASDHDIKLAAQRLDEINQRIAVMNTSLVSEQNVSNVVADVTQLFLQNNLTVTKYEPQGVSQDKNSKKLFNAKMIAQGTLPHITSLMQDVKRLGHYITLQSSQVTQASGNSYALEVTIQIYMKNIVSQHITQQSSKKDCLTQLENQHRHTTTQVQYLMGLQKEKEQLGQFYEQLGHLFSDTNQCLKLGVVKFKTSPQVTAQVAFTVDPQGYVSQVQKTLSSMSLRGYSPNHATSTVEKSNNYYAVSLPFVISNKKGDRFTFNCELGVQIAQNGLSNIDRGINERVSYKTNTANSIQTNRETVNHQLLVKKSQSELKRLGLYHSYLDGVQGKGTKRAIISYQKQMKLPVTGKATNDLLARMRATAPNAIEPISKSQSQHVKKRQKKKTLGDVISRGVKQTIDGFFRGVEYENEQNETQFDRP